MSPPPGPPVVAVLNTSHDIVDMLRVLVEQAGFVVVTLLTYQIRQGEVDIETFLRQHRPKVIVYDIAPPYEPNWRLFQHVSTIPAMKTCAIVLTSTNPSRVTELAGPDKRVYEVVGKPYDLDQIVRAVKEAARMRPVD